MWRTEPGWQASVLPEPWQAVADTCCLGLSTELWAWRATSCVGKGGARVQGPGVWPGEPSVPVSEGPTISLINILESMKIHGFRSQKEKKTD